MKARSLIRPNVLLAAIPLLCLAFGMQAQQSRVGDSRPPVNWEAAGDCLGDVNLDGARDLQDVVRLLRHVTGAEPLTGDGLANADVDRSGTVNLQDVARLRRHVVGLDPLPDCPPGDVPRIASFSPIRAVAGAQVTINGANFGSSPAANTVRFQDQPATVLSAGPTRLVAVVPAFSRGGLVTVTVTAGGKTSAVRQFVVDRFEPRLTIEPLAHLAGSAPPFSLSIGMDSGDIPIDRLAVNFQGMALNTSQMPIPYCIGRAYATSFLGGSSGTTAHALFLVSALNGVNLDVYLESSDGSQTARPMRGQILPGASGVLMELRFGRSSDVINDMEMLRYSGDFILYINPGRITLPPAAGSAVNISATASARDPAGGSIPAREFSTPVRLVAPAPGGPVIRGITPFDPSFRQEVDIAGSGFSSTGSENTVSFAGSAGIRVTAPVLSSSATLLTVAVPAGAANGAVRVDRGGISSNDFGIWMAFSPSLKLALHSTAAGAATGLTLDLTENRQQLATQTFRLVTDRGGWNWAALTKGAKIGTVTGEVGLFYGYQDLYVEESDGATSATLVFKNSNGNVDNTAKVLFASESPAGVGIYFLYLDEKKSDAPSIRLSGTTATFSLNAAVFRNPAPGPLKITSWLSSTPAQAGFGRPLRGAMIQTLNIQ